jgi:hypothetical protein
MRIGILLSNLGGSPLQAGLERGFVDLGHTLVDGGKPCDLLVVFNQTAHNPDYCYPPLPDHTGPMVFIDCAEYGYFKRLPGVVGRYWNAFAEGSVRHDTKNVVQQQRLRNWLEGKSFPYFIREFSKHVSFPIHYHPIDYPLYYHSECHQRPNREEYLGRELDLFVSWGASHPWRVQITEALRNCHTRCEISVLEENGTPRMPQRRFFERTRAAKCSVSFDGYGSSSFRLHEILVRCLLLAGPLSIDRYATLVNRKHYLHYSVESQGEFFLGTNVCKVLRQALENPELSYEMYERGYYHCMEHYTEKATAEYVLAVAIAHDWRTPTPLDNPG